MCRDCGVLSGLAGLFSPFVRLLFFPFFPSWACQRVHAFVHHIMAGDVQQTPGHGKRVVDGALAQRKTGIHVHDVVPPQSRYEQGFPMCQDGFVAGQVLQGGVFLIVRLKGIDGALDCERMLVQPGALFGAKQHDVFARQEMGVEHVGTIDVVVHARDGPGPAKKHKRVFVGPTVANRRQRHVARQILGMVHDVPQKNPEFRRPFLDHPEVVAKFHGQLAFHVVFARFVKIGVYHGHVQVAKVFGQVFKRPFFDGWPIF